MTARLDRLERAGMTERRPDPNDRRGKLTALTAQAAQGRAIVDETLTKHVANDEKLLAALTPAEQERLNQLLKKLIAAR
jgi:DNA-binding MarR family transcriptional regulator